MGIPGLVGDNLEAEVVLEEGIVDVEADPVVGNHHRLVVPGCSRSQKQSEFPQLRRLEHHVMSRLESLANVSVCAEHRFVMNLPLGLSSSISSFIFFLRKSMIDSGLGTYEGTMSENIRQVQKQQTQMFANFKC